MEKIQLRKELQQGVEFVGNAEAKCGVLTAVRDEFVTRRETTGKSEEVYFVKRLQSGTAEQVGRHKHRHTAGRAAPGGNFWSQSTAVPRTKPAARPYRDPCQVGLGLQQPCLFQS